MGFMEKIDEVTSHGIPRVFGKGSHHQVVTDEAGGIGTAPLKTTSAWKSDDGSSPANVITRGLQIFFSFINLCIWIAIAAFQKKWNGTSFLTGASLFVVCETLVASSIILSAVLLYETIKPFRGVVRLMTQIRAAFIINVFHVALLLVATLATTISANVGGCKDPEKDEHKDVEGYIDAMSGSFCRNKRAGAAFFWLSLIAWSASLAFTILEWYDIRKDPASHGFAVPQAQGIEDDNEAFSAEPASFASRPSQSFYEGDQRVFDVPPQEPYHDPFADQQPLPSYPAYPSHHDPYEAIRQSMDAGHR